MRGEAWEWIGKGAVFGIVLSLAIVVAALLVAG